LGCNYIVIAKCLFSLRWERKGLVRTCIFTNKEDMKNVTTRNMEGDYLNYNREEEDHHKQNQCEQQTQQWSLQ